LPASLEIVYSALPTDVDVPPNGSVLTAVVGDISVADIYANALQDYILYRAWTKDSDFAGNGQRAMAYYGAFAQSIGIEIGATITVGPQTSGT
jgi:peroxiredoxin